MKRTHHVHFEHQNRECRSTPRRVYFSLDENCLVVKITNPGAMETGFGIRQDGRLANHWHSFEPHEFATARQFLNALEKKSNESEQARPRGPRFIKDLSRIKIKPDAEARFQNIIRQLIPS